MSNTKNKGFVTNSVIALKNFIVKPRLNKEQKSFVLENFKASQQEIKDLIAKYFYVKDDEGTYDLKDDKYRESIIRLIQINSVIRLEDFEILEKYFDGKAEKSLGGKEKELCFLMRELRATRELYHTTLTPKEELVRVNGLSMYNKLYIIYRFELLEEYLKDTKREDLNPEDQALHDVIKKYGSKRQKGDIIIFEVEDAKAVAEDVFNLTDAGDSEDFNIFIDGTRRHEEELEMDLPYRELSYETLKKERTKLYKKLEAME